MGLHAPTVPSTYTGMLQMQIAASMLQGSLIASCEPRADPPLQLRGVVQEVVMVDSRDYSDSQVGEGGDAYDRGRGCGRDIG
jgi:hypothetical protein